MLHSTKISAIAAIGENRELGKNNGLLWHIPGELPRFKRITMGHPVIMGRKTHESIGRILPGRLNIIITRDLNYKIEEAVICSSLEQAINTSSKYYTASSKNTEGKNIHATNYKLHTTEDEIFIIGGGQIFKQAMPLIDRLYLTLVHQTFPDADVFLPEYSLFTKVIGEAEDHEDGGYKYTFLTLER